MKTERMLSIVQGRLKSGGKTLNLEENIAVVWHLNEIPKKLPDSKYTGMIFKPQMRGCIVFSVAKRDHKFYNDNPHVTNCWVNPGPCGIKNKWLEPFNHRGMMGKKEKVTVRTEKGVDIEMEI